MKVQWTKFYSELLRAKKKAESYELLDLEEYKTVVRETLRALAIASPQWSGLFASNWRVSVQGVSLTAGKLGFQQEVQAAAAYDTFKANSSWGGSFTGMPDSVKFRGDPEAVAFCMQANDPIIAKIKTSWTRVTFINETPYATQIAENNRQEPGQTPGEFLRPGNYIDPKPIPMGYVKTILPTIVRR